MIGINMNETSSEVESNISVEEQEEPIEHDEEINLSDSDESSSGDESEEERNDNTDDENVADEDKISAEDRIRQEITEKYAKSDGKKLYVLFPAKLPEDDAELEKQAKALSPLVIKARRPRQRHARFCMVNFATTDDREKALKDILERKKTTDDSILKRTIVKKPRFESEGYIDWLVQQKLKKLANKKTKRKLKKQAIKSARGEKFTSTLLVCNLPKRTSTLEIRSAFPTAVDVQMRYNKAAVTLPSPMDARNTLINPPTMAGVLLKLRFDNNMVKSKKPIKKVKKEKKTMEKDEQENANIEKAKNNIVKSKKPVKKVKKEKKTMEKDEQENANIEKAKNNIVKSKKPIKKVKKDKQTINEDEQANANTEQPKAKSKEHVSKVANKRTKMFKQFGAKKAKTVN